MPNDHGPSVKNDKQYEGLRKKGMSKAPGREDREYAGSFEEGRQEVAAWLSQLDCIDDN